jgi:hypothetical protein
LITEAEYLTIAQNVISVGTNWYGGVVGTNYIYSGHNDGAPNNALVAGTDDVNGGYYGETNQGNQRRTLTLTNGQVIWDMAGNLWEWTNGVTNGTTAQQPGISGGGWNWREWTAITTHGTLSPDPFPGTTGISSANGWNSSNGIGQIYSNANDTSIYGFIRGGAWGYWGTAGVLTLDLGTGLGGTYGTVGFRVSR